MLQDQLRDEVAGNYKAVEMRLKWLKWAKSKNKLQFRNYESNEEQRQISEVMPQYVMTLESGDTFYMNRQFCDLVDHARQTVPDDLEFDSSWLQSQRGWMWVESPFLIPSIAVTEEKLDSIEKKVIAAGTPESEVEQAIQDLIRAEKENIAEKGVSKVDTRISAVSWFPLSTYQKKDDGRPIKEGSFEFLCWLDYGAFHLGEEGFGCWSYFHLQNGDRLLDRIKEFEVVAGRKGHGMYEQDRITEMTHEIRWIYAAMYLMAQRLTVVSNRPTNHAMRKLAKRENQKPPDFIRTITLRRLEQARVQAQTEGRNVDWQWQWSVRGHWRNQFFRSTGEHKPVFIESYVKGPAGKPMKPMAHTIFIARR